MRLGIFLLVVSGLCCTGCTHMALQRNTVKQASTLTDLQYQQVLDNLAMFSCNPDAMAWHLKLATSVTQITDQSTGMLAGTYGTINTVGSTVAPTISGQRGVVDQWGGVPAVDPEDLEPLQYAYLKALNPLDADGKIQKNLYDQVCDVSIKYDIPLSEDALIKIIDRMEKKADETENNWEARKWDLKRRIKTIYQELDKQFEALVKISHIPSDKEAEALSKSANIDIDVALARLFATQSQQRATLTATRSFVEDQIVKLTREIRNLPYTPRYPHSGRTEHNPHDVGQAEDKIKSLLDLADDPKFKNPWVSIGCKKDVPKCVCYVGHYCRCGHDCYIWVLPEHLATLRDFTIAVLNLAPLESQETVPAFPSGGVSFSPSSGR